jgi:hypothetical protein
MMQDGLFHMEPLERPGAGGTGKGKWGGSRSRKARALCRAMLPAACWRCGRTITAETPESEWHAGHLEDRAQGGADLGSNYAPECTGCNLREGGKLGAAITNGKRVSVDWTRERTIKWY